MDEMAEISVSQPPEAPHLTPTVEYDPFILSGHCPYRVEVADNKVVQLLEVLGLADSSIKKLKIKFIDTEIISPDGRSTGAAYENGTITISSGTWWRFLNNQFDSLDKLLLTQGVNEVTPEKLPFAREKARETANAEAQKKFDHDFIHECSHFAADISSRIKAMPSLKRFDLTKIAGFLMQRASLFTPEGVAREETKAKDMVSKIENDKRWKNIVVVTPR